MTDRGAVLVTGGAGYVAPPTVRALAERGRAVVVLDDFSTGHREHVRWGTLVEGDIADQALVRRTLREHGVVAVLHFAAKALVGESVRDPELYDRWNRGKTTVLARVAAAEGVRAFVFSSTCAVYGVPERVPIDEEETKKPINPYGASKVACEEALFATGVPTAALRYFNAAGAEPEHGLGERHDPETHLIPLALRAWRTGEPITVLGTDYPTPDGTCVRDYIHVTDLAAAHVAALERLEGGGAGGAWNLGTGRGASVREVLEAAGRVLGRPVPFLDGPRREGDPPILVARAERAATDLGWRPAVSDLQRIVADAAAYEEGPGRGRPLVVTLDGPAGVGKSSVARRVADALGWAYLDTGATYRLVTLAALEAGVALDDEEALVETVRALDVRFGTDGRVRLGDRDAAAAIRSAEVTAAVPRVAARPGVRRLVVDLQRRFAARAGRLVAEGRDTGTVVFPDAAVKVYLDGEPRERARRRRAQEGDAQDLEGVLAGLEARDRLDRTREASPLACPEDAWRLDTTSLTLDEVTQAVLSHVRSRIPIASRSGS